MSGISTVVAPSTLAKDPLGRVLHAVNFAAIKHRTQTRKDQDRTPYINHPIGVEPVFTVRTDWPLFSQLLNTNNNSSNIYKLAECAYILYFEGGVDDDATLMAAILHDTVEDTETTWQELETHFGAEVTQIVRECTDDKSLPSQERKRLQVVNAPHKSHKAKLVKMADKIYNLRDLQRATPVGWTQERAAEYFIWAKKVTDGCIDASPKLAAVLDTIYTQGHKL